MNSDSGGARGVISGTIGQKLHTFTLVHQQDLTQEVLESTAARISNIIGRVCPPEPSDDDRV